jgi:hypothetical protein
MKIKLFTIYLCILSSFSYGQKKSDDFFLTDKKEDLSFIGYNAQVPVFCKQDELTCVYSLKENTSNSFSIQYLRNTKYNIIDDNMRLLWIDDEMEIYVLNNSVNDENLIIVTDKGIDTLHINFNSYYQDNCMPFILTDNRKTLYLVQPEGYQDENLGWYYDNIMQIDLTRKPLIVEKLPITGIQMQKVGNFLYYKGGSGELQDAILRVEIPKWEQIDTLVYYAGYWFVKDNILYTEIGRYTHQDKWFGENRFIAYSIDKGTCAIISKESPGSVDRQPIVFKNQFYNFWSQGITKIQIPTITEFPYKQTLPK